MDIDSEQFDSIKKSAEEFYKNVKEIYCPFFQEIVAFNAKGLDHIKFKEWNKTRLAQD